jgi:hypothetical protein
LTINAEEPDFQDFGEAGEVQVLRAVDFEPDFVNIPSK